jgi:hypothetical protein
MGHSSYSPDQHCSHSSSMCSLSRSRTCSRTEPGHGQLRAERREEFMDAATAHYGIKKIIVMKVSGAFLPLFPFLTQNRFNERLT